MKTISMLLVSGTVLLHVLPAQAQAMRTWVSGVGDDSNPCSRTAPCKTFAGAIAKTMAGGEISLYDSGGFGTVIIRKSISIVAVGYEGGISAASTTGVTIEAGPEDVVNLDGLYIEGFGSGKNGILVTSAGTVNVRNTTIVGFRGDPGWAINVTPTGNFPIQVFVSDSALLANTSGVFVTPNQTSTNVHLDRIRVKGSQVGILVQGKATAFLSGSTISGNGVGLSLQNGGEITSFGNNVLAGNQTSGTPTATLPLQ